MGAHHFNIILMYTNQNNKKGFMVEEKVNRKEEEAHDWQPGDCGHWVGESGKTIWEIFRVVSVDKGIIIAEFPQAGSHDTDPGANVLTWPGGVGYTREYTADQIKFVTPSNVGILKAAGNVLG